MAFNDIIETLYRSARKEALTGNVNSTVEALRTLSTVCKKQFGLDNDDSILTKAKLKRWEDFFAQIANALEKKGFTDEINRFFGISIRSVSLDIGGLISEDKKENAPSNSDSDRDDVGIPFLNVNEPTDSASPITEKVTDDGDDNTPTEVAVPTDNKPEESDEDPADGPDSEVPVDDTPSEAAVPTDTGPEGNGEDNADEPDSEVPADDGGETGADDSEEKDEPTKAEGGFGTNMEPMTLDDFIGQKHVVKRIKKEIAIAKNEGRKHLDNILLFGNPGLGKTTLMALIAKELGVKFEWLDCATLAHSHTSQKGLINFFSNVAAANEPVLIGMDEIHCLSGDLQSALLTLLNSRVFISPPDPKTGQIVRIPIESFTFCGATTDDDKVLSTIKDRCRNLTFQLKDYTKEELRSIFTLKLNVKNLTISPEALETCIDRCRSSIREVETIVKGLYSYSCDDETGEIVTDRIDMEIVNKYFNDRKIDKIGLNEKDVEILLSIKDSRGMYSGADTLSAKVGLTVEKYLSEYQPYLVKIGFIEVISGRGQTLTEKAIKYLNENYPNGIFDDWTRNNEEEE